MSEFDPRRAFLDEVLAHPDDDVPRLIFADFLEEEGDPRGTFIRLQCELNKLDPLDARYLDLSLQCDELLNEHRDQWAAELKQDVRKIEFARGFIDKITIRARAFAKQADELFCSTPVNWLRFNYVKGAGEMLAETEAMSKIRRLDLSGLIIPEEDLITLLRSSHLDSLLALDLAHYEVSFSESVAITLAEMPAASFLEELTVNAGSKFLSAMGGGEGFPRLRHLTIGASHDDSGLRGVERIRTPDLESLEVKCALKVADCESLARLPLSNLQRLGLTSTRIPGKGLKLLADAGAFNHTVDAALAGTALNDKSLDALLHGEQLAHCEKLNLSHNYEFRNRGQSRILIERLARHRIMANLRQLRVSGLDVSDLPWITDSPQFHALELLELESSRLGDGDVRALLNSPLPNSLKHLRLINCGIEPEVVTALREDRQFPNLIRLDLGGGFDYDGMDESDVMMLLSTNAFPNVQAINLDFMQLTAKTLMLLAERCFFPELRELSFAFNRASRKSIDWLMNSNRLPKLAKLVLNGTSGLNREKLVAEYGSKVRF